MAITDCRGVPLSTDRAELSAALDIALDEALAFEGDPIARISAVLAEHPDFVMGHCFKAGLLTQAMETRIYDEMVAAVEAAEAFCLLRQLL